MKRGRWLWRSIYSIEMEKHADKEEEQESDAVQDKNIRDVRDMSALKDRHLLFGSGHENHAGGVEQLYQVSPKLMDGAPNAGGRVGKSGERK